MKYTMQKTSTIILMSAMLWSLMFVWLKNPDGPVVDPKLEPYVAEWKANMETAGIHYEGGYNRIKVIRVSKLGDNLSGLSAKGSFIAIDKEAYQKGGCALKFIVFHELGHNVFNLNHTNEDCSLMERMVYTDKDCKEGWDRLKIDYLKKCKENEWEAR